MTYTTRLERFPQFRDRHVTARAGRTIIEGSMNPDLQKLQPYPFEKLQELKRDITPATDQPHIAMSIGEPKHATPQFMVEEIIAHLHLLAGYPVTRGEQELRKTVVDWLCRRYGLPADSLDPDRHVLPVSGTREGLFAIAQCVVDPSEKPLVMMPNPFYQIYEGAALLAGAEPCYLNTVQANGFVPDFAGVPEDAWRRCQLLYLCSPGNPTGTVLDLEVLKNLLEYADEYDFVVASDECYSEIYLDEAHPPTGLLQAASALGRTDFHRCLVFNSLSKRSNAPGLRSGFVAGDPEVIAQFLRYRTYHGCAMPPPSQRASIHAWKDEAHVRENRALYRAKLDAVLDILHPVLPVERPAGGFYLWPQTPIDDTEFARELFARHNVTVLPGTYLSRRAHGVDPGERRVRIALVAPLEDCIDAAHRIRAFTESL